MKLVPIVLLPLLVEVCVVLRALLQLLFHYSGLQLGHVEARVLRRSLLVKQHILFRQRVHGLYVLHLGLSVKHARVLVHLGQVFLILHFLFLF